MEHLIQEIEELKKDVISKSIELASRVMDSDSNIYPELQEEIRKLLSEIGNKLNKACDIFYGNQ